MAVRLDKVLTAWRANPRPQATIELCNLLIRASSKPGQANAIAPELVVAFGEEAVGRHPDSVDALLAIAGLYITAGELERAEATLSRTAQLAPEDPRLIKLMGKIRLHRGIRGSGFPAAGSTDGSLPRGISFIPPPPVARMPSDPHGARGEAARQGSAPSVPAPPAPAPSPAASWAPPLPPRAQAPTIPEREAAQRRTSTRRGIGDDIPAPRAMPFDVPLDPFPQALPSVPAGAGRARAPSFHENDQGERTPAYGYELHEGLSIPMASIEIPMDREELLPDDHDTETQITSMNEIMSAAIAWSAPGATPQRPAAGSRAEAPVSADERAAPSGEPASDDADDADDADGPSTSQRGPPDRPFAGLFSDYRKESTFSRVVESLWGVRPSLVGEEDAASPIAEEQEQPEAQGARDPRPRAPSPGAEHGFLPATPGGAAGASSRSGGAPGPGETMAEPIESRGPDAPNVASAARAGAARHFEPGPGSATPGAELDDRRKVVALTSSPSAPPGRAVMPSAASGEHEWRGTPAPGRPASSGSSSLRRAVVVVLVLATVAGGVALGYFQLYPRLSGKEVAAKGATTEIDAAILRGGPRDLAEADAALQRAAEQVSTRRDFAVVRVRERALRVLDDDPDAPGLTEAIAHARALGASHGELAFAEVTVALGTKDAPAIAEVLRRHDADAARKSDPFYQLAAGAALDAIGDAGAIPRYRAAALAEPRSKSAELRLSRALLLQGDAAEGRKRALALAEATGDRPEAAAIRGLLWLVDRRDAAPASQAPAPAAAADLPRTLRCVQPAMALFAATDAEARQAALAGAIHGADTPAAAVFFGALALTAGETASALHASQRALEMAPGHAPALRLLARIAFATAQLEGMEAAAARLPPADAAEIRAMIAYEAGDFAQLGKIAEGLGGATGDGAAATLARRDRLLGATISPERLAALRASGGIGVDILVIDVALDAGDLEHARELMAGWTDASTHALRALRWARLLRYEGKLDEARAALEAAAPTRPALIERLLLEAETDEERAHALAVLDDRLQPERLFFESYLRARQGNFIGARAILGGVELPAPDAPLSLRLAAALALGELHDTARGLPMVQALIALWPRNPDAIRAAVGLGLLPKSLLDKRR